MPLLKTFALAPALVLVLTTAPGALAATPEAEITSLVRSFKAAEQAYDAAALAKLIDERYVEVSPAGEVDAHDRFLGFYSSDKKQPWPAMTISEEDVRVFGDTAIEILREGFDMKGPDGQMHTREIRSTFIAKREGGTWKLIGAQFTGIRPLPPAVPKQ